MAKDRTSKSKYPSKYAPGTWVTEAQFLTEKICENIARKESKQLTTKFWQLEEWKVKYMQQIRAANELLKLYDFKVILGALERNKNVYSFRSPYLNADLIKGEKKLSITKPLKKVVVKNETTSQPQTRVNKKTKNLRNLDD